MVDINAFEPLRSLDDAVLGEIVREGELRIQAQFSAATAADQRALTIAGFQIASASAAMAGGGALVVNDKPNLPLALLALMFAVGMIWATIAAIRTVRPAVYDLPGNSPKGWLPGNWMGAGSQPPSLKQARIEQAACLDAAIADNKNCAEIAAKGIHRSIDITIYTVCLIAALLLIVVMAETSGSACKAGTPLIHFLANCNTANRASNATGEVYIRISRGTDVSAKSPLDVKRDVTRSYFARPYTGQEGKPHGHTKNLRRCGR